ncbi:MAG TPA: hypothetical protein VN843_12855, partial [Anaerolineales bacterium]|nr:hypothetical protein [Anaerolineales bacterium]
TGNSRVEYSVVRKVAELLHILDGLHQGEVIEWVAKDGHIFLVQSRPLLEDERLARRVQRKSRKIATPSLRKKTSILADAERIGLKAAAMQLFVQLGWFTKGFVLIPPQTRFDQIRQTIRHARFGNKGLTVRFSRGGEIGLPRFFVKNKTEALRIIAKHADSACAVIIHDHINVKNSFEVFVGTDRAVLEHMPGMWESNTRNAPDVIIAEADEWFALRVSDNRSATFEGPRSTVQTSVTPPTEADLYLWANTLKQYITKIRTRFSNSLPLIFHCVSEDGLWQFLNIRTTETVQRSTTLKSGFHLVTTPTDLKIWDGKKPILLRISTNRGSEDSIADLVSYLPKNDDLVFIDFGALSHPAIMLREFGVNPKPVYLTHERIDLRIDGER